MKTTYMTQGTCSRSIEFELQNDIIKEVNFVGGCRGNLVGISTLVTGMCMQDVIRKLKGIKCRNNTSCPDQLAHALETQLLKQAS